MLEQDIDVLSSNEFKEKYGALMEEINIKAPHFYPLYLLRRFVYAGLIVFLYEYPIIQLVVIICVTLCPVFIFT